MKHSPINTILDEKHIHIRVYVLYAQLETSLFELGAMETGKQPLWKMQEREHSTFSHISEILCFKTFFFHCFMN